MEFFDIGGNTPTLMKIGVAVNNTQIEKWFIKELEGKADVEIIEEDTFENEAQTFDGLIILRKNRNGGISDPVRLVKNFMQMNEKGLVLFVVGIADDEGVEIIRQLEKIAFKLFVIASPYGRVNETDMRKGISDVIAEWDVCNTNVYRVFSPKGGCGATTLTAALANFLSETEERVAVAEKKNSLQFHKLNNNVKLIDNITNITAEDIRELQKKYHYVILDDILDDILSEEELNIKTILIMDCSAESIDKVKNIEAEKIVLNFYCPNVLPKEIIEKEIGKKVDVVIEDNRGKFLQASVTGETLIKDIEELI